MLYNIGQKVLVRKDLDWRKSYSMEGDLHTNSVSISMQKFRGKIVTITHLSSGGSGYRIKEDNQEWVWTDEMLELSNEITLKLLEEKKTKDIPRKVSLAEDFIFSFADATSRYIAPPIYRTIPTEEDRENYVSRWLRR